MQLKLIAFLLVLFGLGLPSPAAAQEFRALARLVHENSYIRDVGRDVDMKLSITQAVPFRVRSLASPRRIVIDFREVVFGNDTPALDEATTIKEVKAGKLAQGWSRIALYLTAPLEVASAGMTTDPSTGSAEVLIRLTPTTDEDFAKAVDLSPATLSAWRSGINQPENGVSARPVIAIDPGHGGVDPGAQRKGHDEADLMLTFARELRELLIRTGRYDVILTRDSDAFVSLPARVSIARAAEADIFISLHADALAEGRATGTTIYTLSEEASDKASALLAERQDRADILAGVDLVAHDDEIATVLMDMARRQTEPRTNLLADYLVEELRASLGNLHKRPRLKAGFSVLKAPDIPSVLLELGFMSSERDLNNLLDEEWREKAALGILAAFDKWTIEDAARREAQE